MLLETSDRSGVWPYRSYGFGMVVLAVGASVAWVLVVLSSFERTDLEWSSFLESLEINIWRSILTGPVAQLVRAHA